MHTLMAVVQIATVTDSSYTKKNKELKFKVQQQQWERTEIEHITKIECWFNKFKKMNCWNSFFFVNDNGLNFVLLCPISFWSG